MSIFERSEKIIPWKQDFLVQSKKVLITQYLASNLIFWIMSKPLIHENFFLISRINRMTDIFRTPSLDAQGALWQYRMNRVFKFTVLNIFLIYYFSKQYSKIRLYESSLEQESDLRNPNADFD